MERLIKMVAKLKEVILKQNSIVIGSLFISIGTLISRIAAFYRDILLVGDNTTRLYSDIFYVAISISDLLYFMLVGGMLGATFVPYYVSMIKSDRKKAWDEAQIILKYLLLVIFGLFIVFLIDHSLILNLFVNLPGNQKIPSLLIKLTYILVPTWFLIVVNGFYTSIINAEKNFIIPSISLIVNNVLMILFIFLLNHSLSIYSFAIGVLVGSFAQSIILVLFLIKKGYRFQFNLRLKISKELKRILLNSLPMIICLGNYQFNLIIFQRFSFSELGVVTAAKFLDKIIQLFFGIFVISLVTAAYPFLIENFRDRDYQKLNYLFNDIFSKILSRVFPFFVILYFFGSEIISILELFTNSSIDEELFSKYFTYFSVVLVSMSFSFLFTRIYLIYSLYKNLMIISIVSLLCSIFLNMFNTMQPINIFVFSNILYTFLLIWGFKFIDKKIYINRSNKKLFVRLLPQFLIIYYLHQYINFTFYFVEYLIILIILVLFTIINLNFLKKAYTSN